MIETFRRNIATVDPNARKYESNSLFRVQHKTWRSIYKIRDIGQERALVTQEDDDLDDRVTRGESRGTGSGDVHEVVSMQH